MKKRYIALLVIFLSLVGFATPNLILGFINHYSDVEETTPAIDLAERQARFNAGLSRSSGRNKINYQTETKQAIIRELKEKGQRDFEVSKIVFTSEKSKTIAGKRQVALCFTYQLQYKNGKPKKLNGSILLASDGVGNWFDSTIKI